MSSILCLDLIHASQLSTIRELKVEITKLQCELKLKNEAYECLQSKCNQFQLELTRTQQEVQEEKSQVRYNCLLRRGVK